MQQSRETGSALGKAVRVLEVIVQGDRPATLAELAQKTGLPRQTVHRIVRQLEDTGIIQRGVERDQFTVGPQLLEIGTGALSAASHSGPARAVLRHLVEELGETCNVGVLDRDEVVYIDRVECDWPLRLQLRPGSRVPIHATAIGKLLLAHLPSRTRRRLLAAAPLAALTDKTLTDPEALEVELREIRRDGYALNAGENTPGLIGLAVPIKAASGRVMAGLAVHGPEPRLSMDQARAALAKLQTAADKLADLMIPGGQSDNARSAAE